MEPLYDPGRIVHLGSKWLAIGGLNSSESSESQERQSF